MKEHQSWKKFKLFVFFFFFFLSEQKKKPLQLRRTKPVVIGSHFKFYGIHLFFKDNGVFKVKSALANKKCLPHTS